MTSFFLLVCHHNVQYVIIRLLERIRGHVIMRHYYFIYWHNLTNQYQYLSHLSLQHHS